MLFTQSFVAQQLLGHPKDPRAAGKKATRSRRMPQAQQLEQQRCASQAAQQAAEAQLAVQTAALQRTWVFLLQESFSGSRNAE